ncbi:basic helix-loop-helix domain-containing protein [Sporobolomyces koalae]|uniref:basic helix-loop-helix domain-containing protein n=1 Tax=Sporobolomyces koalae TaxID=500713 RepID=UPI00317B1BB2
MQAKRIQLPHPVSYSPLTRYSGTASSLDSSATTMATYANTGNMFDTHWQTPLGDSGSYYDTAQFGSYDPDLLDVFTTQPFQPYPNGAQDESNLFDSANQSIASIGGAGGSSGTYSDAGSSPQGNLSYASSTGYSTGMTSHGVGSGPPIDYDLESIFTAPSGSGSTHGDSPPFDFGSSIACNFNTSTLESLFVSPTGHQEHFLQQPHLSGLSPASTANGASPHANAFQFLPHAPHSGSVYPPQFLAPDQSSLSAYPTPARNPSISSSGSPLVNPIIMVPEHDPMANKRRRMTLAETAGLNQQPLASTGLGPTGSFTVKPDSLDRANQQIRALPTASSGSRSQKAPSPVEVIANAGMSNNGVYKPPTYQLLPKPANVASTPAIGANKNKRGSVALSGPDDKAAGGAKRKKTVDRGHNAVEQKYRNSINNALATLRDTIPALQHLKPLPSMPVSKRKASQFTLPSSVATVAPTGLVDGVPAAKTLSKGVILNKAIEYIDFLRFAREAHNEDLEMLKDMVRTMVGGGAQLVAEFEQKRDEREAERARERELEREEAEGEDDGDGDREDEEEEEKNAPAVPNPKRSTATKARGTAKKDTSAAKQSKSLAANAVQDAKITLASQQISPPLTSDYRHVQALNAAHLDSITAGQHAHTHTFPPSPVSSDDLSVSPAALSHSQPHSRQPPRVLLASFMGLSFAGGLGYDLASGTAAAAEEAAAGVVGSAWTSRLVRRSLAVPNERTVVDFLHPSLLSGLVALGIASIVVSSIYVLAPLFSSRHDKVSTTDTRRSQALSSLAKSATSTTSTYASAKSSALMAREELRNLVGAPSAISLLPSLVKEAAVWVLRHRAGLSWTTDRNLAASAEQVEQAVAWIRIAEIEATVGVELSSLSRFYTFLRLSNLSHSASWPQISASTSRPAVTALLAIHLASSGHLRWAEALWQSISALHKKEDQAQPTSNSFVDVAVDADFETVKSLFDPASAVRRIDDDTTLPSDTVPLLQTAEAMCADALEEVWSRIFAAIVDTTCPPHMVDPTPSKDKLVSLFEAEDVDRTLAVVLEASVAGSEIRSIALMTRALIDTLVRPQNGKTPTIAKSCIASLLLEARQGGPFARFASAAPFCQLLLPSFSTGLAAKLPPVDEAINEVDHLAATTLSWLLLRRQSLDLLVERSESPDRPSTLSGATEPVHKINPDAHARALAIRQLLAHSVFRGSRNAPSNGIDFDEAKDLLVDALTTLARRAAGLTARDDDSGVEM